MSIGIEEVSVHQSPSPRRMFADSLGLLQASSSDDEDDYGISPVERGNRVTLPSMNYTADELMACLLAYKLKGNHSDRDFFGLLEIFVNAFPQGSNELPSSLYFLRKELDKLCLLKPTYVVYCVLCETIVKRDPNLQKKAHCSKCDKDLEEFLKKGKGQFVTIPIRDQIELYVKDKCFANLIRKFGSMTENHPSGKLHEGLIKEGHFDLNLDVDGAQLHNKMGASSLPAYLRFNNIPVCYQNRYPIMAALYVGKKCNAPPRHVFLESLCDELRELAKKGISWCDDLGKPHNSFTFLTGVLSDGEEKWKLLNHVPHNAQYGCPLCFYPGKTLLKETFPQVFDNNPFRRTTGDTLVSGGKRYPKFPHEVPFGRRHIVFKTRGGRERVILGMKVAEEARASQKFKHSEKGVRGIPPLYCLPRFHETDSHVSDTLHVVCSGVLKDIFKQMLRGHGKGYTFAREGGEDKFKVHNELQATRTRVSESDRNCTSLDFFASWTAYDFYQFVIHDVALLCSDPAILADQKMYEILMHLANCIYLCHHGRMTDARIALVERELAKFAAMYKAKFREEYCTYKLHIFMVHFVQFLRNHGSAFFYDGFNMERFNLIIKNLTSACSKHTPNIVRNFILKYHCSLLSDLTGFGKPALKTLRGYGFTKEFYGSFRDSVRKYHPVGDIPSHILTLAESCALENGYTTVNEFSLQRVLKMSRRGIILETVDAKHPHGSLVNDSYVTVDEEHFGQISDIVHIVGKGETESDGHGKFAIIVRKFYRITPLYDTAEVIQFPMNQFPFVETLGEAAEFHCFLLKPETFIQKAQICSTFLKHFGLQVKLFTVKPNEWFRF
jgi:hypothetical protein